MDGGQDGEGDHNEDRAEFLSHGFPSMPDAFRQLLSTIHNEAARQAQPTLGA